MLSALESLNIAILKAMDKTKEVSLHLCEFALVQVCMVERTMVGVTQIHKQSWGYRLQKSLKQILEGNTEMACQLKWAF